MMGKGGSALKALLTRANQILSQIKHPPSSNSSSNSQQQQQQSSSGQCPSFPSSSKSSSTPSTDSVAAYLTPDLKCLTDMMHSLSAESVYLHRLNVPKLPRHAATFIEVENNHVMTAVIIILPPGEHLPLHDHPNMIGLIKVLHGQVRVTTYNKVGPSVGGIQHAIKTQDNVCSRLTYPQILTPQANNIHAIAYAGSGSNNAAAEGGAENHRDFADFLDILSPPYDGTIGCHYYSCEEDPEPLTPTTTTTSRQHFSTEGEKCILREIECPSDYKTISMNYPYL